MMPRTVHIAIRFVKRASGHNASLKGRRRLLWRVSQRPAVLDCLYPASVVAGPIYDVLTP